MGDFFHGWRRKIGVVTLLMACLFAAGWVRSYAIEEEASFTAVNSLHQLSSDINGLEWRVVHPCYVNFGSHWYSSPVPTNFEARKRKRLKKLEELNKELEELDRFDSKVRWRSCGFCIADGHDNPPSVDRIIVMVIPHWSPVFLLTLLSAFLLLSKPRKSIQMKSTEPITNEGK